MMHRQHTAMLSAYQSESLGLTGPDPMRSTALTGAAGTFEDARSLAYRVSALVDRLCGAMPAEGQCDGKLAGPGSILGSLRDDADQTAGAIRVAMIQLDRLDRELP